jgi:hypothetical protein
VWHLPSGASARTAYPLPGTPDRRQGPDPRSPAPPRAGAVKAGRHFARKAPCGVSRPRLDGPEYGGTIGRSGGGAKQAASAPRSSTQLHNLVKSRKSKTASPISVYSKLEGGTKAAFSAATLSCSDHKSRSYSMISTMRRLRGSTMTGRSFTIAYR